LSGNFHFKELGLLNGFLVNRLLHCIGQLCR
jgi:hypothetical protein